MQRYRNQLIMQNYLYPKSGVFRCIWMSCQFFNRPRAAAMGGADIFAGVACAPPEIVASLPLPLRGPLPLPKRGCLGSPAAHPQRGLSLSRGGGMTGASTSSPTVNLPLPSIGKLTSYHSLTVRCAVDSYQPISASFFSRLLRSKYIKAVSSSSSGLSRKSKSHFR